MYLTDRASHLIGLYFLILFVLLYMSFYQQSVYYLFFTNTILAYIPIELTFIAKNSEKMYIIGGAICLWFVFLPNNFYLITDLFHLSLLTPYDETTLLISKDLMNWYKLFLISLAVIPTTFLGCWSIETIATILVNRFSLGVYPTLLMAIILFFNSLGIYIGRFTRLNSTDFFMHHKETIQRILDDFETIDNQSIAIVFFLYVFSWGMMIAYKLIKLLLAQSLKESEKINEHSSSGRQSSY